MTSFHWAAELPGDPCPSCSPSRKRINNWVGMLGDERRVVMKNPKCRVGSEVGTPPRVGACRGSFGI